MDSHEQIQRAKDFLDEVYEKKINNLLGKGLSTLVIDFADLMKHDPEMSEELLENPEDLIRAFELAMEGYETKNFKVRFTNLPQQQFIEVRNIRSLHLDKLMYIEGIVRQSSDVRPQVTSARFECPSCGNTITILQIETRFKEPSRCTCGRRGKFRLLSKDLVDAQRLVLEESPESLEGGEQPKRLSVFLKEDLVEPKMEKRTTPGSKVRVYGIVKEVPILLKTGAQSIRYDLMMDSNYIEPIDETYQDIEVNPEEEQEILNLSKDARVYEKFISSIAPSIYGHEDIKEAILLQLMGGVRKKKEDGTITRGDLHILLVGDPGSAKSTLLTYVSKNAPKTRYVSGRGTTGAGISASVVKDEFLKGWALEAGAIVLANKGIVCIDELDKMTVEDTSAMHEAMEQQSYHPNTEIMLADGSVHKIGDLVESILKKNKEKIIKGKDCEISSTNIRLLTTDFKKIYSVNANRVSRHKAPNSFIEIVYTNGRKITVTPEHPIFIFDSDITTIPAEKLRPGVLSPAPRKLPIEPIPRKLKKPILNRMNKPIAFPDHIEGNFAKFMGYFVSEGHSYFQSSNNYAELGVSNTNPNINEEVGNLMQGIFKTYINQNITLSHSRKRATLDLVTTRCCSKPSYIFFRENFPESLKKAPFKRVPNPFRMSNKEERTNLLKSAFRGDGFIDSERFGYSTSSYNLAKDYQDLLLSLEIYSYIAKNKIKSKKHNSNAYKVVISGSDSMKKFIKKVVSKKDQRGSRLKNFLVRSLQKNNDRDTIPFPLAKKIKNILEELRIDDGAMGRLIKEKHNFHRETAMKYIVKIKNRLNQCEGMLANGNLRGLRRMANLRVNVLSNNLGVSLGTIYNLEARKDKKLKNLIVQKYKKKINKIKLKTKILYDLIDSEIRFVRVKSVRKIKNKNIRWMYDVTIEPNHTFVSENLILHNTITISKANIQATLRAETTVLAAANPKLGRFDPYAPIASQINLPPALINRFDLIFPIRDIPHREKDKLIASHVLKLQQKPSELKSEIDPLLFRKYISYAKNRVAPILTNAAIEEIMNFYVELRNSGSTGEEGIKPIPISARQLEALVRLAEGSARVRLSKKVTRVDAKRSIKLLKHCLMQVGIDPETGEIDIDRISTGVSSSQRSRIVSLREIIFSLDKKMGKNIPIEEIIAEAAEKGIDEIHVQEAIEKLKREGEIFEPKSGHISKM